MKKLSITLYIILTLLLTSFVSADTQTDLQNTTYLKVYYTFDDDDSNTIVENLANSSLNGTSTLNTDTDAIIHSEYGTGLNISGDSEVTTNFRFAGCTNYSLYLAYNLYIQGSVNQRVFDNMEEDVTAWGTTWGQSDANNWRLNVADNGDNKVNQTYNSDLAFKQLTYTFLPAIQTIYFNGTPKVTLEQTVTKTNTLVYMFIGGTADENYPGANRAYMIMYEFGLWCDKELTQTEMEWLADNPDELFEEIPPPSATSPPTIDSRSPADNSHNNTNVSLIVNHSTTQNDVNYYLYFGDSTPLDEGDLYLNNVSRDGEEYKNFTTNVSDGTYYWKWKVQNTTDGLFSTNTTQRTLIIDTVIPIITLGNNNNFSADNSTIISSYLNNLSIDISFFDTYLYQTLINITNESGQSTYSNFTTTITGTTLNVSETIDISTWAIGDYTIKLEATDSHTITSISKYDVKTGLDYFRYTTEEGNIIKIKSDTFPLTKSTTRLKDRYDFKFNYLFQKDIYKFIIESYNKIDYIKDSDYKAHFVIMGSNGGNWIDFENPNLNSKDYNVIKIDDYTYEVEITANGIKSFTFNSIGGLNKRTEHYLLKLGAVIDIWIYDEENYPRGLNGTATIGTQSANSTNTSAAQLANITKDITSLNLTSSGFGTEEKSISITNNYHNLSFNMTAVSAVKLYFYDENSNTLIGDETFSVYLETTGFSNTYSTITTNPYSITGLGSGLYKLKASSANYPERQYLNLNISNETTTILNIYLVNNTLSHEVTFTVQGSGGAVLDNADINFFRIINGTNTLIAEENTDFAGKAKLYLDPNYEYDLEANRDGYIPRNLSLEPSETDYIIILLSGVGPFYDNVYAGVRFRFYYNGVMSTSPPDIINLTNTTHNITFEVEGADLAEIGINFTNHNYACTPASCSVTLAGAGQVKLGILLNESGTFNTAYYFQKTGGKKIYVNDGLIKVIPFIFASLNSLPDFITAMKEELSPNVRTLLVAMLNVIAVGVGSSLGLAGAFLILPVLAVTIICSLPEIGLIHPFIGMIIAIFGVVLYVYAQSR